MSIPSGGSLNGYLRRILRHWPQDERSDAELLTAFSQSREERAFNTLVARYGLLVWGICRRVLRHTQDAEDAFQAAFLILAQKAGRLRSQGEVSRWLSGVARNTAWNIRSGALRRRRNEQHVSEMSPVACPSEKESANLLAELDEQIERLPRRYREVLVLCRLSGKTFAEAASELGCSVSAINYRLSRAEQMLRERLGRRGLALSGVTLAATLSQVSEVSAMPARLSGETVRVALAFVNNTLAPSRAVVIAQGVMQSMGSNNTLLWAATLAALLCLSGFGLGLVTQPMPPEQAAVPPPVERKALAPPAGQRLDLHGDPLPEGALARIGTLRFRPDKWGRGRGDGAFLPDGKTLVSVHGANTAHFWDLATGKERWQLQGCGGAYRVCVSIDGRLLAVCGVSEFQVWDMTADPPRLRWVTALHRHKHVYIHDMAFSPDGKKLAYNDEKEGKIVLLDTHTWKQLQALKYDQGGFRVRLSFSPDGKCLLGLVEQAGETGTIAYLWDPATGKKRYTFTYLSSVPSPYFGGGFSPDSRTIVTQDPLRGITLWDVATGKEKRRIATEGTLVLSAVFLPDGTLLGTLLEDGARLRFWDPGTGEQRRPDLGLPGFGFNSNWRLPPDGKLLAAVGKNIIQVWNMETGNILGPEGISDRVTKIAFSPSGDTLATLSEGNDTFSANHVSVWQANTGAPRLRLKFDPPQQTPSVIIPLGLSYGRDHRLYTLRLTSVVRQEVYISHLVGWDTRTGKAIELPLGIQQAVGKLKTESWNWAMAPDGQFLALVHKDDIVLYEMATGKEVRRLQGLAQGRIRGLIFSADGQSLLGHSSDKRVDDVLTVWDVATGRQLLRPLTIKLNSFAPFTISADGRWLAAYTVEREKDKPDINAVQVWEVASGRAGLRLLTDPEEVRSVAWSPDSRMLATGCEDGTVLLWEVSSGQKRHSLKGHRGAVVTLVFSADGSRLASGSADTTALTWDLRCLPPPAAERPKTEELLSALSRPDAAAAYRAIAQLAEAPDSSIADLRKRLQPIPPPNPKQVQRWLDNLDSKDFKAREYAFAELAKHIDSVEGALRKALEERPTLEKRLRLEKLLERLDVSRNPARLFILRCVEVLERIGTLEARKVLEELALLPQGDLVSREAQAALRRLSQQRPPATTP